MQWKSPPVIKMYEALGAIADGRVHMSRDQAKVYSSSGNKYYTVSFESATNTISSNDNGSFWRGYLGYPAIAYLACSGRLMYRDDVAQGLKGTCGRILILKCRTTMKK